MNSCRSRFYDDFELSRKWFEKQWKKQKGRCAVSGVKLSRKRGKGAGNLFGRDGLGTKVSIDRIECSIGYTRKNSRLVAVAVNLMRHNMTDERFLWWCFKIIRNFAVYEKI